MELLIVGGGLAAQRCIEALRAAGDDRRVTVVCDEPVPPYDRPPLSKEGLLGDVDPAFRPAGWYRDHAVELRLGAAACGLDPLRRTVTLEDGERLRYDALLIDLCLDHGDCEAVAPEAFRVDDVARVVGETTDERLLAAAHACPAGAIVLYDADTGEEVDA